MMEPCCWSSYTQHRDAEEKLKMFHDDENEIKNNLMQKNCKQRIAWLKHSRSYLWAVFEKPFSSFAAQVKKIFFVINFRRQLWFFFHLNLL